MNKRKSKKMMHCPKIRDYTSVLNCINYSKTSLKTVIFIGGYITGNVGEKKLDDFLWITKIINKLDIEHTNIFIVNWDSKSITSVIKQFITSNIGIFDFSNFFKYMIINTSFTDAYKKSIEAGKKLAKAIVLLNENGYNNITLIGHSLGGKIAIETMNNLYTMGYSDTGKYDPIVSNIILLGAAAYINEEKIKHVRKTIVHNCINVYNPQDNVLKLGLGIISSILLMKLHNINSGKIAGIKKLKYFTNINCSTIMHNDMHNMSIKTLVGHNYIFIIDWLLNQKIIKDVLH